MRRARLRAAARTLTALLAAALLAACAASAVADAADLLLVVNKSAHTVGVHDLATGKALATVPTGYGPHEVAAKTWTVSGYWEAGDEPDGMAVAGGRP